MDDMGRRVPASAIRLAITGRVLSIALAAAVLIMMAPVDMAGATGSRAPRPRPATITIAPARTTAGARLAVSGSGLRSREVGHLLLGRRPLGRIRAGRRGGWRLWTRIPTHTPLGGHSLRLLASGRQVIAVRVRVAARPGASTTLTRRSTGQQLLLSPNRAAPGARVALVGSGFGHHQMLALRLGGRRVRAWQATSTGRLSVLVGVPSTLRPGRHVLSLRFGGAHLDLGMTVTKPPVGTPPPPTPPTPPPPAPAPPPAVAPDPVVVAAGDLACSTRDPNLGGSLTALYPNDNCEQQAVATVAAGAEPAAFLTLGDNENGPSPTYSDSTSLADFQQVWAPTFGRLNTVVYPEVGNADYSGSPLSDSGFMEYFEDAGVMARIENDGGDNAHLTRDMYYSFNLGAWHIIALNTECSAVGGCATGSPEEVWLHADLAAHRATCTLAYWHVPLWNSVSTGRDTSSQAFWTDLYAAHADVILNAHGNNHYENFVPLKPTGTAPYGTADRTGTGIREFIVSNGGYSHGYVAPAAPTTNAQGTADNYTSFGVLKLSLHPSSFDWEFLNAADSAPSPFHDSGHASCH